MLSKSIVICMLIFIGVTLPRSSRGYLYFVRFFKLFWISLSAKYTDSMCLAPARFLCQSAGDCTWSIAPQLQAILVGNVADWSFHIMGSQAVFKCQNT